MIWFKRYVVISPNWFQLCKLQWLVQSLREPLVWSHHLKQLLKGTWSLLQCPTSVFLPLSLSGCHCLSSVWSSPHWSPSNTLCRFCRDFLLELLAPALPQLEHLCHRQTGNIFAACANLPIMFFQGIRHDLSRKMLKRVGDRRHPCLTPTVVLNYSPIDAIHLDCTCSLVIELLNGAN